MVARLKEPIRLEDRRRAQGDEDELYPLGFADWLADQDKAVRTIQNYYHDVLHLYRWHEQQYGDVVRVHLLTPRVLVEWKRHMRMVQQLSPSTINRRIAAVRALCKCALAVGHIDKDPSANLKKVRVAQPAFEGLDKNQKNALLRVVERSGHTRNIAMVHLMLFGGLRISEVANLGLLDVHIGERKGHVYIRASKGDKDRTVPLTASCRASLAAYIAERGGRARDPRVFLSSRGTGISVDAIDDMVHKYGREMGLPDLHAHQLRHTYARNLLESGTDIVTVSRLLGQSSIEVTARYCLPTAADLAAAVARLDAED